MTAPDISQIKHEPIRQRAAAKLAAKRFRDIVGSLLMTAVIAAIGALFLGFLFYFIGTMSRGYGEGSFLSSYILAFILIAGVFLAYIMSTEGFHAEHELNEAVAAEFEEDAELTRKEEWERDAPRREAATRKAAELEAEQLRQKNAHREALLREQKHAPSQNTTTQSGVSVRISPSDEFFMAILTNYGQRNEYTYTGEAVAWAYFRGYVSAEYEDVYCSRGELYLLVGSQKQILMTVTKSNGKISGGFHTNWRPPDWDS